MPSCFLNRAALKPRTTDAYKPLHDNHRTVLEAVPNDLSGWNNLSMVFLPFPKYHTPFVRRFCLIIKKFHTSCLCSSKHSLQQVALSVQATWRRRNRSGLNQLGTTRKQCSLRRPSALQELTGRWLCISQSDQNP